MKIRQRLLLTQLGTPVLMAAALSLLIAGCSSPSSPSPAPQAAQPMPPPPALNGDQMAKVCQEAPETCHRIQTGQPMRLTDVKVLAKLGINSDVIIKQIRISHTVYHLAANDIIDLKNSGVSDQVMDFMISTPNYIGGSTPVPEPATTVNAQTPPPAPPPETATPAPGPDYVWVGGDWVWNGAWVWVGGHWVFPPYPGAIWIHGGWSRGWRGFHRAPGHWR
jgi:hypothetical protein